METLKSAINLVPKDCFFTSVDLTDAYYSCMVDKSDRKFLRFIWEGEKYQYTCLPNGLATAPRIFTKIMKPVFSTLRKQGHANVSYIDDSLLISKSEAECVENIKETVLLLDKLAFTVHPEKSVLYPTKLIQFLGFWINSAEMVVSLTCEKAEAIETLCKQIVEENTITIRKFAQLIGKLVASEPGVTYAPLYYKTLEIEKDCVLKESSGDFDSYITVSNKSLLCIQWWIDNVTNSSKSLEIDDPILVIKSDSSMKGWGCFNENTGECAQGFWNDSEKQCHINYLELKAGFLGIKEFCSTLTNCHVKLYMDNTVAVTYINKMGGKIENLNDLTKNIWIWCMNKNIWLSASHIAGVDNIEADFLSRDKHSDMEWMLNKEVFDKIQGIYGVCDIDLFASKHNKQLPRYSSYMPDKHAHVIDAFSVNWSHMKLYIFCPFSVMTQVLAKIERDKSEAVLIAPIWATQTWFPKLLHLICQVSYILPKRTDLLILPHNPMMRHPLEKMRLGVFRLSGNQLKVQTYQKTLLKLYVHHGKIPLQFCCEKQINPFTANVKNVLMFFTKLFKSGLGYSSINTARCSLTSFLSLDNSTSLSSNILVRMFMKGIFTLRPTLPRYNVTWDVNKVLNYLQKLSPLESLSLLELSQKLLMLLLLLSGQRGQTIHLVDVKNIFIDAGNVKIIFGDLLKTSKQGKHLAELNFSAFPSDKNLCILEI